MTDEDISAEQLAAITAFVDTEAPPPDAQPTAHIIFGTNQAQPIEIVAKRYHHGLAPLIIATGGVNRHNGIIEGRVFHRLLLERGVPDEAIRYEDQSINTWQNVELALPFLREALEAGLTITAVCKWYHRRAVHVLKTLMPDIGPLHVITWDPIYEDQPVARAEWPLIPAGRRRVIREWEEVTRRVAEGSFRDTTLADGAWR
ncbi:YdcF family protein [Nonomuraea sp. NPDC050536]|uniref:YdcF family protein n=1 Tax=Nonomuraea sp. NPDC050536 TaxID=3364366 RepID=UPI0037C83FCA